MTKRQCILTLAATLAVASPCVALEAEPPVLDPVTVTSASGQYAFSVDPTDRNGAGPSDCRLRYRGALVWSHRLPYTVKAPAVTDQGEVVYCHTVDLRTTQIVRKDPLREIWGYIHLFRIDRAGRVHDEEQAPIDQMSQLGVYPSPDTALFDKVGRRYIVQVSKLKQQYYDDLEQEWWEHRLPTAGTKLARVKTFPILPNRNSWVRDVEMIPGTPCIVLCRSEAPKQVIEVIDGADKPVWSWTTADDDSGAYDVFLPNAEAGCFSIRRVDTGERVDFRLTGHDTGTWKVSRLGTSQYPRPFDGSHMANVRLNPLTPLLLRSPSAPPVPDIRGVGTFTFAGPGRVAFIRSGWTKHPALVVASTVVAAGTAVYQVPLTPPQQATGAWSIAWLGGDRYAVGIDHPDNSAPILLVDVKLRRMLPVNRLGIVSVNEVAAFPDGRFVIVGDIDGGWRNHEMIACFNRNGKVLWHWSRGGGNIAPPPETPEIPDHIAVVGDCLAGVDEEQQVVNYYDGSTGELLRSARHAKWPASSQFLVSRFSAAPNHRDLIGALSLDGGGLVAIDPHGALPTRVPRRSDMSNIDYVAGVDFDAAGRLWVSDGNAIYRLGAGGVARQVLGEAPLKKTLREIEDVTIDPRGDIYAIDSRSHIVHRFDAQGRWLRRYVSPTNRWSVGRLRSSISSHGNLAVYEVFGEDNTVCELFDASGQSRTIRRTSRLGAGENVWTAGFKTAYLSTPSGVRTIDRRADDTWLRSPGSRPMSVSPDGRAAFVDVRSGWDTDLSAGERNIVAVYLADGTPQCVVPLPPGLHRPAIAFDGNHIVAVDDRRRAVCLDLGGRVQWTSTVRRAGQPFLTNHGRTLMIRPGSGFVLDRYRMPSI